MNIARTSKSYAKDSCRGGRHTSLLARKPCLSSKMLVEVELMMQLSLNGLFLCGTRGKQRSHQTIFQQAVIWRFQTTLPDFQKENYILNQMITENDFFESAAHVSCPITVCKNLKYKVIGKMNRLSRSNPKEKAVNL